MKKRKWIHGLPFGSGELQYISEGRGCEAYAFTYRRDFPTKAQMKGARKEYRQRIKRKLEAEVEEEQNIEAPVFGGF